MNLDPPADLPPLFDDGPSKGNGARPRTPTPQTDLEKEHAEFQRKNSWQRGLIRSKEDVPKKLLANTRHVIEHHPDWQGVVAYDAFSESIVLLKTPPMLQGSEPAEPRKGEWTEGDTVRAICWFAKRVGFEPSSQMIESALLSTSERTIVHPIRDYLGSLVWDGMQRLPELFFRYFAAEDSVYTRAVGTRWLISAVARVMKPGCQSDSMPVLEGPQGSRKSTGIEALFGKEWFSDSALDLSSKDCYQSLRHVWCHEFAELDSFKGRDATRIKSFLSARVDTYRPSYGRTTRPFPRQVCFCGSTNEREYLIDRTGNRRFWPIGCGQVDVEALRADRDQLWAEALVRYQSGESWYLDTRELCEAAAETQEDRVPDDAWLAIVSEWLENPTVPVGKTERARVDVEQGVTNHQILLGALDFEPSRIHRGAETKVGAIMHELGWSRKDGTNRPRRYVLAR